MFIAPRRVLIGPPGSGRSAGLLAQLRQLAPRLAGPALVLTPTEAGRAALAQRWGRRAGAHFATLRAYALQLLAGVPEQDARAVDGRPMLSAPARRLLLRGAWRQLAAEGAAPMYGRYGSGPGALDALLPCFDLLASALGSADPQALVLPSGLPAELLELGAIYQHYLELTRAHGLLALQEIESQACDLLGQPGLAAALPWRLLVVDDLDAARPEQLLLLRRLAEALTAAGHPPAILAAAAEPDPTMPAAQRKLLLQLTEALGLEPQLLAPRPMAAGPLLARLVPGLPDQGRPCAILELQQPEVEGHAIAQELAADLLAHPRRRFADYAVVCWNSATLQIIRRVLADYGILVSGHRDWPLAANPLLPLVRAGAALLAGRPLPVEEERALLLGPPLLLASSDALAVSRLNGGLLALLEGRASAGISERAHGLLATLAAALAAARLQQSLAEQLRHWLDASAAFGLLEAEPGLPLEQDQRAACRRQIERALSYLEDLQATAGRLREQLDPAALPQLLDEALLLVQSEPAGAETDAVAVWAPDDLYGRRAAVVFLAGMDESSLPAREPALQPVPEEQLCAAFEHLPGFVPPQRQNPAALLARARRQLALALSRASDRVVLSYSRSSPDGTPCLPSPLFLELLGPQAIAGEQLQLPAAGHAGAVAMVTLRRGLGRNNPLLSLAPAALAATSPPALLPQLGLLSGSGPASMPTLPATPTVDAAFRASATAVRDFLACPRRYFYARLLQLGEEEGERLALGQLFHATLERLMDEWDALVPEQRLRRGLATFREQWVAFAHRLGPPLHQASYRRLVRRGLAALIEHETRQLRLAGRRPIARERRFRLAWRDGTLITGVLDRVDRLPDGRYAVIDYKTGSLSPSLRELVQQFLPGTAEQSWQLSDIQLPIYAYALEAGAVEGLPAGEVAEVSLLYPFKLRATRGGFSREGWRRIQLVAHGELRIDNSAGVALVPRAALERTWHELDAALAAMRAGPFPAQPREPRVCRSCPYRFTCPQPLADDEGGPA